MKASLSLMALSARVPVEERCGSYTMQMQRLMDSA